MASSKQTPAGGSMSACDFGLQANSSVGLHLHQPPGQCHNSDSSCKAGPAGPSPRACPGPPVCPGRSVQDALYVQDALCSGTVCLFRPAFHRGLSPRLTLTLQLSTASPGPLREQGEHVRENFSGLCMNGSFPNAGKTE